MTDSSTMITTRADSSVRWPFRVGASLITTFAGGVIVLIVTRVVVGSAPAWNDRGLLILIVIFGSVTYVFGRIAVTGSGAFLPLLNLSHTVTFKSKPRPLPVLPLPCISCGQPTAPREGAVLALELLAVCRTCLEVTRTAGLEEARRLLGCLDYPPDLMAQLSCSFCLRSGRSDLMVWPGGAICMFCASNAVEANTQAGAT
jgi:hypothetical protein